jgi:hypothetical protein
MIARLSRACRAFVNRLACLLGLHHYETHIRAYGGYLRVWRFCRRCPFMDNRTERLVPHG